MSVAADLRCLATATAARNALICKLQAVARSIAASTVMGLAGALRCESGWGLAWTAAGAFGWDAILGGGWEGDTRPVAQPASKRRLTADSPLSQSACRAIRGKMRCRLAIAALRDSRLPNSVWFWPTNWFPSGSRLSRRE